MASVRARVVTKEAHASHVPRDTSTTLMLRTSPVKVGSIMLPRVYTLDATNNQLMMAC